MKTLILTVAILFAVSCDSKSANSSYHNSSPCDHNKANCANKNTNANANVNTNANASANLTKESTK